MRAAVTAVGVAAYVAALAAVVGVACAIRVGRWAARGSRSPVPEVLRDDLDDEMRVALGYAVAPDGVM